MGRGIRSLLCSSLSWQPWMEEKMLLQLDFLLYFKTIPFGGPIRVCTKVVCRRWSVLFIERLICVLWNRLCLRWTHHWFWMPGQGTKLSMYRTFRKNFQTSFNTVQNDSEKDVKDIFVLVSGKEIGTKCFAVQEISCCLDQFLKRDWCC